MTQKQLLQQQRVSLFQNLLSIVSVTAALDEVLRLIRYDSSVEGKTDSYRKMMAVLGKAKADEELKQKQLPAVSVAVLFDGNGRKAAHILGFTGLALVDIDSLTPNPSPKGEGNFKGEGSGYSVLDEAFEKVKADPHTLMVYRTVSGEGLRIIYRYEREATDPTPGPSPARGGERLRVGELRSGMSLRLDATSWRAAFLKGNQYYAELTGHEYDEQCGDYSRLCGLAHDEQVYVNWEAMPFVISDAEILTANFDGKNEKGKPRREHPTGTFQVTVDDAWPKVEQALQRKGMVYQSGHHHDYVMHAAFLMNRYGVDLDELLGWASQEWSDYDAKQRDSTIRSCYRKTNEHGTWRLNRQGRKAKETSMITLPEIREWLRQHVEVIYNVVTDMSMYRILQTPPLTPPLEGRGMAAHRDSVAFPLEGRGTAAHRDSVGTFPSGARLPVGTPLPCRGGVGGGVSNYDWQQLDERVVCSMRSQMAADTGKRVLKNDVMDVLHSDFARLYHPVREYIEALPGWDGKDRVKELARKAHPSPPEGRDVQIDNAREHFAASGNQTSPPWEGFLPEQATKGRAGEASSYFEWSLHKWLVAMVATWMSDLSTNHEIFVLIGSQGIYKTTFFRHLLPPPLRMYFWENAHNSFSSKDDHLALAENCLVEIEEIDLQNPRDISELKALATSEKVKERRPYARFREEKHRLASFCGSGNQQRFLSDDTGNRRWLCHKVTHIDDPRQWGIDYDQLYAQLRDELRRGFRYWFDADEQRIVERQNQAFRIESDEEQLIRSRLRPPHADEKITLMNAASIAQYINGGIVGRGLSTRKISLAMPKLGFKRIHTKLGGFYEVYQIPPNELQATLAMAEEKQETALETTWKESELPF